MGESVRAASGPPHRRIHLCTRRDPIAVNVVSRRGVRSCFLYGWRPGGRPLSAPHGISIIGLGWITTIYSRSLSARSMSPPFSEGVCGGAPALYQMSASIMLVLHLSASANPRLLSLPASLPGQGFDEGCS